MTPLMFAYGSNLNLAQMARRCPNATALGRFKLPNWRLVFRHVADCIQEDGAFCYGGVWKITEECEQALDIYEGFSPDGNGMYRKEYIPIKRLPDGVDRMMIYVMNSTGIMPPSEGYLDCIKQGYHDFRMPKAAFKLLNDTVQDAWDDKAPSHIERQRHRRNGRPRLAAPPSPAMPATGK